MSLSPPAAKKAKLSTEKQIGDLADADLAAIFQRLSPIDRLTVSEVCRRWHGLSRKDWLDVVHLDLGPIPAKHIGAIVRQCPKLQSVTTLKKPIDASELFGLSKASQMTIVKLYDCRFGAQDDIEKGVEPCDAVAKIFSRNAPQATWNELILHNMRRVEFVSDARPMWLSKWLWMLSAAHLPASLTRLQLSGLRLRTWIGPLLEGIDRLQNLECFILHDALEDSERDYAAVGRLANATLWRRLDCALIFQFLRGLKNLRELCVGGARFFTFGRELASLPKLEILFLSEILIDEVRENFATIITGNAARALRVLVLSGDVCKPPYFDEPVDVPPRKRFPHGLGSNPLPPLHIFVGRRASERLRFAKASEDAALVYPINEPMPSFLERPDIAPIFEGCWIAEKIKETAKHGGKIWNYDMHDSATGVQRL